MVFAIHPSPIGRSACAPDWACSWKAWRSWI